MKGAGEVCPGKGQSFFGGAGGKKAKQFCRIATGLHDFNMLEYIGYCPHSVTVGY